jgi:hypothetical protein
MRGHDADAIARRNQLDLITYADAKGVHQALGQCYLKFSGHSGHTRQCAASQGSGQGKILDHPARVIARVSAMRRDVPWSMSLQAPHLRVS